MNDYEELKMLEARSHERLKKAQEASSVTHKEEAEAWKESLSIAARLTKHRFRDAVGIPLKEWLLMESERINVKPHTIWTRLNRQPKKWYPNIQLHHHNKRVVFVKAL